MTNNFDKEFLWLQKKPELKFFKTTLAKKDH